MKKIMIKTLVFLTILIFPNSITFGQEKLAQTGMQFLSVISDARAASLGGMVTSRELNSNALFFNPATMGFSENMLNVSFSINKWIADINHNNASISFRPGNGNWGVFGASVQVVDYGDVQKTIVASNEKGYEDLDVFSPTAYAAGLGYSKMISQQFSVGGQIKYIAQNLGASIIPTNDTTNANVDNDLSLLAYDFGTLYKTGFGSTAFGFSVRNFSSEAKYAQEGFELPLTFSFGVSMDLTDLKQSLKEHHALNLSVEVVDARSFVSQMGFGLEYSFIDKLFLRGGYISGNDQYGLSFGTGFSIVGFTIDYSYTPLEIFGNVSRITASLSY
jgi:hypothetical protein